MKVIFAILIFLFFVIQGRSMSFEASYMLDTAYVLNKASSQQVAVLGLFEVAKQLSFSEQWKTFISAQASHGDNLSSMVGDEGGISNIATEQHTFKLYQAYVQRVWEQAAVMVGFYDINSEFYVTEASLPFLHSSFGIGAELAQTGVMGPSIFPNLSYGIKGHLSRENYLYSWAVLNAVGANSHQAHGTHPHWSLDQGIFTIFEVAHHKQKNKFAMGGWLYSQKEQKILTQDREINWGIYLLQEHSISGASYFFRLGYANGAVNEINWNWSLGVLLDTNWWKEAQLGIAFNSIQASQDSSFTASYERVIELTYHLQWNSWLEIQPDLQYIFHPGIKKEYKNALVYIQRLIVSY